MARRLYLNLIARFLVEYLYFGSVNEQVGLTVHAGPVRRSREPLICQHLIRGLLRRQGGRELVYGCSIAFIVKVQIVHEFNLGSEQVTILMPVTLISSHVVADHALAVIDVARFLIEQCH